MDAGQLPGPGTGDVTHAGEAERDGANGVVGVHFAISNYAWGHHTVEFYVAGTAVRHSGDGANHHAVVRPADE